MEAEAATEASSIKLRWLQPGDEKHVVEIIQAAYEGFPHYDYSNADGFGFLAEIDGKPAGVVLFWPGRPETWIRELAVKPEFQGTQTMVRLMRAVGYVAREHGSRAVAGTVANEDWAPMFLRAGMELRPKTVARFWMNAPKSKRFLTKPSNVPS